MPAGLGEPVFDRLDADIAHALMSINAVKGVEIGEGFNVVALRQPEITDEITAQGFRQPRWRHPGGISGGQHVAGAYGWKPTSSITVPGRTINRMGEEVEMITKRAPRSVCEDSRSADRRGHAGDRADGSPAAPSGTECRM